MATIPIAYGMLLAAVLFGLGLVGVLVRRNVIFMLMSIEIMLNAANINFVAFSVYNNDVTGQVFALFSIAVAAAEVAVGLAILLNLQKQTKTIDVDEIDILRW